MHLAHSRRLRFLTALICVVMLVFPSAALAATPLLKAPERADPAPPPWFDVDPNQDTVWGNGWAPSGAVDVLIGNPLDPSFSTSAPTDGSGNFNTFRVTYDLVAGQTVTVTDGASTRTTVITALAVTATDPLADTVSGTAAPGSVLQVGFDGTEYYSMPVTADGAGNWVADFTGQRDMVPGSQGNVRQDDGGGDSTSIRWRVANPHFKVQPDQDTIWGHEWVYGGGQVEIGITHESVTTTFFADIDGSANFNTGGLGYNIQSGDSVAVTDGTSTKAHVVTALEIMTIDTTFDTIGGTAAPGTQVWVDVFGTNRGRQVIANGSGYWLANFGAPAGEEESQQTWDIKLGDNGHAEQNDDDSDVTWVTWRVRAPVFRVSAAGNNLWGNDWLPGGQLTVTIGNPASPDYETTVMADGAGNLNTPDIGYDIEVGDLVTVSDAEEEKSTTVTNPTVTVLDVDADIVGGTAQPNAPVFVNLDAPDGGRFRNVTADGAGNWSADFSVAVGSQPQDQIWDLKPGDNGGVDEYDADGDSTSVGFHVSNPWFRIARWNDSLWGGDWLPNAQLSITVGDPGNPVYSTTAQTDGGGNFNTSGSILYDVQTGDLVTVTDGASTKGHVCTALTVDIVDAESDTIMGTANPGALVSVNVNAPGGGRGRNVNADPDGIWVADFSVAVGSQPQDQPWDLVPGDNGAAEEFDDDGDATNVPWQIDNPTFAVDPEQDSIWGWQWAPGTEVGITIGSPLSPDFADAVWTDEWGNFGLGGIDYDIQPGETVTVTDGTTVKEHSVFSVTVTGVDVDNDLVYGTADPYTTLWVDVFNTGRQRNVDADASGAWVADFGNASGDEPWAQTWDIGPGSEGAAGQSDGDGDSTQVNWRVPNPGFSVNPADDSIWGWEWAPDSQVTLTIGDVGTPDFEMIATVNEWGEFNADSVGHNVQAGDLVTVTDGVSTKTHVVTSLTLTDVDVAADTVSGTAEPGSAVWVDVNNDWGDGSGRQVVTDEFGSWTADFSVAGSEDWQQPFDIGPGVQVGASQNDDDGDSTWAGMRIPNPAFSVSPADDSIWGWEWAPDSQVTITIGDVSAPDFQTTAGTDEWGNFGTDSVAFDIVPGDLVTVTDGAGTKTHVVTALVITSVDAEADTVSGTAQPGSAVWVDAGADWTWSAREVTTDIEGNWIADFSIAAGGEDWQQAVDIGRGTDVTANQSDEDGDSTQAAVHIPNPVVRVNPADNSFFGHEWPEGVELTITVGDPAAPSFEGLAYPDAAGDFELSAEGYDIVPGDLVTVTDGVTTKTHTVTALVIDGVDVDLDTVYGYAEPGSLVNVFPHNYDGGDLWVTADAVTGEWVGDFTDFYDIGPGWNGAAMQRDEDDDATWAGWYIPNPQFRANPAMNEIWGFEFAANAEITIVVGELLDPDFMTSVVASESGEFSIHTIPGYDVKPGDVVTVSDGVTTKAHTVTSLTVSGVDADADTVYGTAEPGSWVGVAPSMGWFGMPYGLVADEVTGEWVADFSGLYDIVHGLAGTAEQGDDDGDATQIGWQAVELTTITLEHDASGVVFDRFVTGYSTVYSGGGYVYGRWVGTELTATFTGSKITWVGPKQPAYGMADVYIDDVLVATDVDCYAPDAEKTYSAVIWESPTLSDGAHTISIRPMGHKNPASPSYYVVLDYFEVEGAAPAGLGTRIDDSTAAPGYTGSWLHYANLTYFNKTYAYSRWTNAAFTVSFTGTRVAWIGPRTPNYGMADVWIDGVKVATVDCYRANLATQGWREVVWESGVLAPGAHTISIRPTGTKNPAATAANIVIDAIDVTP